jgi:predicted MFS family arabinose efflux permease
MSKQQVLNGAKAVVPITLVIGILACFGDDAVNTSITPALASIGEAFPEVPYLQIIWLYTMPKIMIILFALLSGVVAGRYLSFRTVALLGFTIIVLAGVAPAFLSDFWLILASRMILGIGLGLQCPLGPALVMRIFSNEKQRAFYLGVGNGVINGYGTITNLLVGSLCAINWSYAFFAYGAMAILFLLALLFLREPPKPLNLNDGQKISHDSEHVDIREIDKGKAATKHFEKKSRESISSTLRTIRKLPKTVLILCVIFMFVDCLEMPAPINASAIIAQNSWGSPTLAGIMVSLNSVSGMISGFAFGKYFRVFKQYNIAVSFFIMTIGLSTIVLAVSSFAMGLGLFICGASFTLIISGIQNEIGAVVTAAQAAFATALFMVFENIGGFITAGYMSLVSTVFGTQSFYAPLIVSAVLFGIGGIGLGIHLKR